MFVSFSGGLIRGRLIIFGLLDVNRWFLRRFILKWLPMVYNIEMGGQKLATIKEKTIALGDTYYLDLSADVNNTIDRRLAIASTIMMDVGEHE